MYEKLMDDLFKNIKPDPVFKLYPDVNKELVKKLAIRGYGDCYVEPQQIRSIVNRLLVRQINDSEWNSISQAVSKRMAIEHPNAIKIRRRLKELDSKTKFLWYGIKLKSL
jgi:hypothetical protein